MYAYIRFRLNIFDHKIVTQTMQYTSKLVVLYKYSNSNSTNSNTARGKSHQHTFITSISYNP